MTQKTLDVPFYRLKDDVLKLLHPVSKENYEKVKRHFMFKCELGSGGEGRVKRHKGYPSCPCVFYINQIITREYSEVFIFLNFKSTA